MAQTIWVGEAKGQGNGQIQCHKKISRAKPVQELVDLGTQVGITF